MAKGRAKDLKAEEATSRSERRPEGYAVNQQRDKGVSLFRILMLFILTSDELLLPKSWSRCIWMPLIAGALFCAPALHATTPGQLWPRFSTPSTIINVNLVGAGQNGYDFMATTTFQGAYNQNQLSTRLYVSTISDDPYWLANAVPANSSGVTVSPLSFNTSNPDGALIALLQTYGSSIKGYYICDPYNAPETCNMATTLAGINDAMVVSADNLSVMQNSTDNPNVPLLGDLRVYSLPTTGQYTWIGSYSPLVNTTAINMISNPSGASSTTGWSTSGGTVATATGSGTCAGEGQTLKFTSTTSGSAWAYFPPTITATSSTRPYIFSVQACVASGSSAFLDAWNGGEDIQSATIAAGSGWQTLQLAVPIPLSDVSGNTTIKLEVRTTGTDGTVIYFHNAAAIGNRVAVDTFQYVNQLSETTSTILAQDFSNSYNLRDYAIAGKMFTFDLSSDNSDEVALYNSILTTSSSSGTTRAHNTPIMGYIDDETNDVAYLSGSGRGLFLNASDDYNNGSVWASLPQPTGLSQPAPVAIAPVNNTIYVAMAASDGDNLSIVEHQNYQHWTQGQYLGAVPMAWTISPGMIYNSPGIMTTFYRYLPQSQEMMAGPSGVGYGTDTTGSDISPFASLTNGFMTMEGMSSVTNWITSSTDATGFATDVNVPHVVRRGPVTPYTHTIESNTAHTVLDQQQVDYHAFPEAQISAIQAVPFVSGAPNYIEVLHDNLTMAPDDVLYIAQQLQLRGSHPYVFMTPSELAATVSAAGTGATNTQAVPGSTLTSAFPVNYLWNAQGQEPGAGVENGASAAGWGIGNPVQGQVLYSNQDFLGGGNTMLTTPKTATSNSYVWQYLGTNANPMVVGRYYRFSVNVAGTNGATAFMTIYDGSANHQVTGTISSTGWTNLSQIVEMQSATTGQIQVGITPSSTTNQTLYFGGTPGDMPGWFYSPTGGSTSTPSFGSTTYASAQGNAQAFYLNVPASDGSQWISQFPTSLAANTTYVGSVDVAGTGSAYLDLWNGSTDAVSSTVALTTNWQTVSATFITGSSPSGTVQWEIRVPNSSSSQEVYFRNAMLTLRPANLPLFTTGLETSEIQLSDTNTVDSTAPGGGETNVSSPILQATSTGSHGGTYAIQYGGDAGGGSATHAYMEAFTSGITLSSTSQLSYWIYPITSTGSETGASSMTGNNSTCVAIDIVFTNSTALRNNTAIVDQYGNRINPTYQCNHLQPNQWNYVTTSLGSLSGLAVSRIDIGYDQPGASGSYGGYVDDITISH